MYENFLSYGSFLDAIEKLPTEEYKGKAALCLLRYGHTREKITNGDMVLEMFLALVEPNIKKAKENYEKDKVNGLKGGRPAIDRMKIIELKNNGLTHEEVAEKLGCSTKTVSRALAESGWTKPDKRQNQDKEIDKEEEIEEEIEKATAIEKDIETDDDSQSVFWQERGEELKEITDQKNLKRVLGELAPKLGWDWLNYAMAGRAAAFNKHGFGLLYKKDYQEEKMAELAEYNQFMEENNFA